MVSSVELFCEFWIDKTGRTVSFNFVFLAVQKMRKSYPMRKKHSVLWKRVWDWEKASVSWAEHEKMNDWAALRMRKARSTPLWAALLRSFLDDPRALFAPA